MKNLESFAETAKQSPERAAFTQSLTIISSRHDYICQKTERARSWRPLIELLHVLPNLRTFSLYLKNHDNRRLLLMPSHYLNEILLALPLTVSSIEIDLTCAMTHSWRNTQHSCLIIRDMLPQLKHLRLGRGIWCDQLFDGLDQACPNLRTVLFDDTRRGHMIFCRQRDEPSEWRSDLPGEEAALAGRRVLDAGLLPAIERFDVLASVTHTEHATSLANNGGLGSSGTHTVDSFSSIQRKDILHNNTTSYPEIDVGPGKSLLRFPLSTAADAIGEFMGSYNDLTLFIEHEVQVWSASTSASRRPGVVPKTFWSGATAGPPKDSGDNSLFRPADTALAAERLRPLESLVHWESVCGRKLLYPRMHGGLGIGPVLFRDVCEEELHQD
ncbi:hypothetical protein PMZ80_007728 [Knufia obscura]|uniref:Uncharacterized protein n=2 Tax=Knufia TaxID=430999 RepID=A0AAN8ELU6_9EURO|nr:hypothetical protein PMZ80_007728 [Knufia obscura]KAK5954263.1 hypothetical protein OHC33_004836 [Knufia fluminis]